VAGFFAYKGLSRIYTSSMIVHSFLLTNQEQIQIAGNWNKLLGKGEYQELSRILNTNEQTLRQVKNIKAEEIQKVFSAVNPHGFTITVTVTNNEVLENLQKAIVYGYENSAYVRDRLTMKRIRLGNLISETSAEIDKLDSTKKIIEGIIAGNKTAASSIIIDGSGFNKQRVEMNEKLLSFEEELKFTNAIQVLQGFSSFSRPTGPSLIPWLIIGLMVFLSLAFIYTIYRSLSDKISRRRLHPAN
jgi:hypothetical protein